MVRHEITNLWKEVLFMEKKDMEKKQSRTQKSMDFRSRQPSLEI